MFTKLVLKQCTNLTVLHDENYTLFVVSLLGHKTGEGRGRLFQISVDRGCLFEGSAYSKGGGGN